MLGCGLLLSSVTLDAQPKPPSFLADAPLNPRLGTLHLEAQADAPVRIGADGRGTVTVIVTPKPKMHVYAADADGYVPFTMKVEPVNAVEQYVRMGAAGTDEVEVDADAGIVRNLTQGTEFRAAAIPPFMQELIADGGLMAHIAKKAKQGRMGVADESRRQVTQLLSES